MPLCPLDVGTRFPAIERSNRDRAAGFRRADALASDTLEKGGAASRTPSWRIRLEHGSARQRSHERSARSFLPPPARPAHAVSRVCDRSRIMGAAGTRALPPVRVRNQTALSL